jgi:hypothetical protein
MLSPWFSCIFVSPLLGPPCRHVGGGGRSWGQQVNQLSITRFCLSFFLFSLEQPRLASVTQCLASCWLALPCLPALLAWRTSWTFHFSSVFYSRFLLTVVWEPLINLKLHRAWSLFIHSRLSVICPLSGSIQRIYSNNVVVFFISGFPSPKESIGLQLHPMLRKKRTLISL